MEIRSIQENHILDQLRKDYELLNKIEDSLRTTDDPIRKAKFSADIADLKRQIDNRISEFNTLQNKVLNHVSLPQQPEVLDHEPPVQNESLSPAQSSKDRIQTGSQQITRAINILNRLVERENSLNRNDDQETGDPEIIDDFDLLRIQLITSAKLASYIPSSMLGRHEINRLYLNREKLFPTNTELISLLRMLIDDHLGYIPGWSWFRDFDHKAVESVVLDLAFSDQEESVRQQAFEILGSANIGVPDGYRENISWTITADSSAAVRKEALWYLGQVGTQEYLTIVCSALADKDQGVMHQAKISKYLIFARTNGERSFSELLAEQDLDYQDTNNILRQLTVKKHDITLKTLLKSLDHSKSEIRQFGVNELIRRGEFTIDYAVKLKNDTSDSIQVLVYLFLVDNNVEIDPDEIAFKLPDSNFRLGRNSIFKALSPSDKWNEVILKFYRKYSVNQLLEMIDWNEYSGSNAYRCLAIEHFTDFSEQLRKDLQTDFAGDTEKYYQRQLQELTELYKKPVSQLLLRGGLGFGTPTDEQRQPEDGAKSRVDDHKKYYISAALAGILENGSSDDIKFGRQFLLHPDKNIQIEAIKFFHKWGTKVDVPELVKIVQNSDEFVQEIATQTILNISLDDEKVISELLKTGDEVVISLTISEIILRGDTSVVDKSLKGFLYSDKENIRKRVMTFFVFRYDSPELTDLLIEYTSKASYYYDVVCCFDRALYSSDSIRSFYKDSLKNIFFGLLDEFSK